MVCELEPSTIVELGVRLGPDGAIEIDSGNCEAALRDIAKSKERTTFDIYDRSVVPLACRSRGAYAWNGGAIAVKSTRGPTPPAGLIIRSPEEAVTRAQHRLFDGAIAMQGPKTWRANIGQPMFGFTQTRAPSGRRAPC